MGVPGNARLPQTLVGQRVHRASACEHGRVLILLAAVKLSGHLKTAIQLPVEVHARPRAVKGVGDHHLQVGHAVAQLVHDGPGKRLAAVLCPSVCQRGRRDRLPAPASPRAEGVHLFGKPGCVAAHVAQEGVRDGEAVSQGGRAQAVGHRVHDGRDAQAQGHLGRHGAHVPPVDERRLAVAGLARAGHVHLLELGVRDGQPMDHRRRGPTKDPVGMLLGKGAEQGEVSGTGLEALPTLLAYEDAWGGRGQLALCDQARHALTKLDGLGDGKRVCPLARVEQRVDLLGCALWHGFPSPASVVLVSSESQAGKISK